MEKYDAIGKTYDHTRRADPRLASRLIELLNLPAGAAVADIGAGTGNYSYELAKQGYAVYAVEPSAIMQEQAKQHPHLHWLTGTAEEIPLAGSTVDGIICTLAIHHFRDLMRSFREMIRVVRDGGPMVFFVSDPRLSAPDLWLIDYFGPIYAQSERVYPPTGDVVRLLSDATGSPVQVEPFLLAGDLQDRFFASGWRRPEYYLDPVFRAGVSPFANAPAEVVGPLVERLEHDLKDGTWQQKYGDVLAQTVCEAGYRFLVSRKPKGPKIVQARG
jgi:ubiquinone/menaquinone biosynthesis C-methylase UbiE